MLVTSAKVVLARAWVGFGGLRAAGNVGFGVGVGVCGGVNPSGK